MKLWVWILWEFCGEIYNLARFRQFLWEFACFPTRWVGIFGILMAIIKNERFGQQETRCIWVFSQNQFNQLRKSHISEICMKPVWPQLYLWLLPSKLLKSTITKMTEKWHIFLLQTHTFEAHRGRSAEMSSEWKVNETAREATSGHLMRHDADHARRCARILKRDAHAPLRVARGHPGFRGFLAWRGHAVSAHFHRPGTWI